MSAMCKAAASQVHVRALPKVIIDCCWLLLAKLCWLYHVNYKNKKILVYIYICYCVSVLLLYWACEFMCVVRDWSVCINLGVCQHVYLSAWVTVCVCVHVYVCVQACACVCICLCVWTCISFANKQLICLLHRMGISENRNCKFCIYEIDYIEHFFWSWGKINLIWKKTEEYAYLKFDNNIKGRRTFYLDIMKRRTAVMF